MRSEREITRFEDESSRIQMEASRWVVDVRTSEDWSEDDQAALDRWLNASVAHKVAYLRADHAWGRSTRAAALKQPESEHGATRGKGRRPFLSLRVAAVIGVIAALGLAATQIMPKGYMTYRTPVGGHQLLKLSDGSRLELNTNSVGRIAKYTTDREVFVDRGEVYFSVKHDPKRPFVVFAQGHKIVDLGTKFLVNERPNHLEIAMYEGRVQLAAPKGSDAQAANLTAGDVAVATAYTTKVSKGSAEALSDALSWRSGVLVFHHTSLASAISEFNRYNNYKLVVADSTLGNLEINGKFRTTDITMFADVAADALGLHVNKLDGYALIER